MLGKGWDGESWCVIDIFINVQLLQQKAMTEAAAAVNAPL